jgi:hypothetical protein
MTDHTTQPLTEQEPASAGTGPDPKWRGVLLAAYYAGLGLKLDEDVWQVNRETDEDWKHREWSITNRHGREVGRLTVDTGDCWTAVGLTDRRGRFAPVDLTDPYPRQVLAAAREAGLIPAEPEPLSDAEVEKLGRHILLRGFDMGHEGVRRLYATIARDRSELSRLRAENTALAGKLAAHTDTVRDDPGVRHLHVSYNLQTPTGFGLGATSFVIPPPLNNARVNEMREQIAWKHGMDVSAVVILGWSEMDSALGGDQDGGEGRG